MLQALNSLLSQILLLLLEELGLLERGDLRGGGHFVGSDVAAGEHVVVFVGVDHPVRHLRLVLVEVDFGGRVVRCYKKVHLLRTRHLQALPSVGGHVVWIYRTALRCIRPRPGHSILRMMNAEGIFVAFFVELRRLLACRCT